MLGFERCFISCALLHSFGGCIDQSHFIQRIVQCLCSGGSIFSSSFFTALNDGFTSAAISFLRTVVFQIAAVLLLPLIWGINGIWFSIVVAEAASLLIAVAFILLKRKKYRYL